MSSLAVTVLQVLLAVAGVAYLILGIRSREFAHEPAGKPSWPLQS